MAIAFREKTLITRSRSGRRTFFWKSGVYMRKGVIKAEGIAIAWQKEGGKK